MAERARSITHSVSEDLERLRRERPFARTLVDPFVGLLLARQSLLADLAQEPDNLPAPRPDPARLSQGACLEPRDAFPLRESELKRVFAALQQVLVDGFRNVRPDLLQIGRAAGQPGFLLQVAGDLLADRQERLFRTAHGLAVEARVLGFWIMQMVTPLGLVRGRRLVGLVDDAAWNRGYCPVCGSWPGFARTGGASGKEMHCAFCGTVWHYSRPECPFCGTTGAVGQVYAVPGFEQERVVVCRRCDHFLAEMTEDDLAELPADLAALALVPLEMLAQQYGHKPATMDWRQIPWA